MSDDTTTEEAKPYRIDLLFDGALESSDYFADHGEAFDQFAFMISEYAGNAPDRHWRVDLYDLDDETTEPIDSHEHEAEDEYEVTFTIRVHAENGSDAEIAARDLLDQQIVPATDAKVVTNNTNPDPVGDAARALLRDYDTLDEVKARAQAMEIYKRLKLQSGENTGPKSPDRDELMRSLEERAFGI